LGKDTVCAAGPLLYVGIGRLIPGGGWAQAFGHPDELRDGHSPHLAHDLTAVRLNGDFAGAQFGGDLLVEPASSACWIASSRSWSRKGLVRNSTAPAFMARTVIGMSPWPVIKMGFQEHLPENVRLGGTD
jgi:hypothetical protein